MIHLITATGQTARRHHLKPSQISDFKSLMRTITSGRVMIVSTWFRSDLFYHADEAQTESVIKAWALHANTESALPEDFNIWQGDESSLTQYFQAVNHMARNWYRYRLYKKAFAYSFGNDQKNPMAKTIVACDKHLTGHPDIKRSPLVSSIEQMDNSVTDDTFSLAMRIIKNQTHSN